MFGITRIYGLFAHGVSSWAMESTAVVALLSGLGMMILKALLKPNQNPKQWWKITYNCAMAFLINYLFIIGVLSIAGGSSTMVSILLKLSEFFGLLTLGLIMLDQWPHKTI